MAQESANIEDVGKERGDPWSKIQEEQKIEGKAWMEELAWNRKKKPKNTSSKIGAKEVRIDDRIRGFVRVEW